MVRKLEIKFTRDRESFVGFLVDPFINDLLSESDLMESLTLEDESLRLSGQLRLLSARLLELKNRGLGGNLDLELISA
jgi:hypothetical protein